jgi:molybdopterin-guanine dinucleotide biosynthesis protein A
MEIDAYIFIGGRSSRLGRDKAFVAIDGVSLAERSLDAVRESGIASNITFVAGSETQFAIESVTLDTPFIFDLVEGRGPVGALHAALSYARSAWIFVMACDYPYLTADLIRFLAACIEDEFGAVVPEQSDGHLQPLCAFYCVQTARPIVDEIINRQRPSPPVHEIAAMMDLRIVKFNEYSHLQGSEHFFLNMNTPADFKRAGEIGRKLSLPEDV